MRLTLFLYGPDSRTQPRLEFFPWNAYDDLIARALKVSVGPERMARIYGRDAWGMTICEITPRWMYSRG
jgi:hypothetical protein